MSAKLNTNHENADIRIDLAIQAAMKQPRTAQAAAFQYKRPAKKPRGIKKVAREVARPFKQALRLVQRSGRAVHASSWGNGHTQFQAVLAGMQAQHKRQTKILEDNQNAVVSAMNERFQSVFAGTRAQRKRQTRILEDTQNAVVSAMNEMRNEQAVIRRRCQRQPIPVASGLQLVRLDDRYIAVPDTDFPLLAHLIDVPEYEPGVTAVLRSFAANATYMIDAGANIGLHTITMAREMQPGGRVLALEPTPMTFRALQASLTLNGLSSCVDAREIASGSSAGSQLLYLHPISGQNSLIAWPEASGNTLSIGVAPLDDLVPTGTSVNLVKIDVEGGEYETLKGMERILSESPDIVIVLEFSQVHFQRAGVTPDHLVQYLADRDLGAYLIDDDTGKLHQFDLEKVLAKPSANVLFARRSAIKEKLMDGS